MAEYYNRFDKRYELLLQYPVIVHLFKVEILDHMEQCYGEITRNVSDNEHYIINANKQQGSRRSCTLTMIDIQSQYIPSINNTFWYNRKFKLYIGIKDIENGDIYWFSQGIFLCSNASATEHIVTINGIDKFGLLDGTLNVHMIQETYKVEVGTKIGELVRSTLMLELGNGMPIDPIMPLIDNEFENMETISEISIDPGQYLGEIFIQVANMIGADVYYNTEGRLVMTRVFNDDLPFYYIYRGEYWHFDDIKSTFIEPSVDYQMDGCNYIMVATDNTEGEVYSYTAVNDNARSPVSISHIGYRRNKDAPISYIPLGSTVDAPKAEERCRQYAEYLLLQKTCMTIAISFSSIIMPHLKEGEVVTITDKYFKFDSTPFLIQSITFNGVDSMNLSVVNLQWLPTDTESTAIVIS